MPLPEAGQALVRPRSGEGLHALALTNGGVDALTQKQKKKCIMNAEKFECAFDPQFNESHLWPIYMFRPVAFGITKRREKMKLLVLCAISLVLALHAGLAASEEVEDASEFNYDPRSKSGPARWGDIREEWRTCSNGSMQSPIDLTSENVQVVAHLGRLNRSYEASNATLKNRGHDIMLRWEGVAGSIYVNGTQYLLKQCHWHSPSEHAVNGRRFDLELHMVHESPKGEAAVVGVMYKLGQPDTFLSSLTKYIEWIAGTHEVQRAVGIVNPNRIKIGCKYYRYEGSLTVPPCTENVTWTVVQEVRTVSREQVKLLREAVRDDSEFNARPLQPTNRRPVQLFSPTDSKLECENP
ncbi:alpha carbonic anhydrase 7-like [Rhodamnia argentea]|uniref:Carbonic anhydrase n=1 Tax=Rhodamnia argentea TaxID=178133 RepID=A0ABM3HJE9_9MYRT|nr:alpha carbonic anhydrase 7-like [Rhodamnia argentea]